MPGPLCEGAAGPVVLRSAHLQPYSGLSGCGEGVTQPPTALIQLSLAVVRV